MGVFFGRSAPAEPDRSFALPFEVSGLSASSALVNFASVDANGESAMRSIAVGTSIDLICSLASELPVDVFRGSGSDREQLPLPANLRDPAGDGQGLEDWLYQVLQSWLYRGNVYGEIQNFGGSGGYPRQVSLFHPDMVHPSVVDGTLRWYVNGQEWTEPNRFLHRRVNPVAGRVLGMSVIERHAMQIGTSLAASKFGEQWFADGAHPSGLLTNAEKLTKEEATTVKERWMSLFRGNREPAVLGKGWTWQPIQINPAESQFLETQRFTEAQCARMFGPAVAETLGYETGGSMTYANVVDRRSDLLTFTLNRWLTRAERLLSAMLPSPQYARFNRDALLQSTTLARYEAHSRALADRWRTVNEIRDIEELAPVAWGDEPNQASEPRSIQA